MYVLHTYISIYIFVCCCVLVYSSVIYANGILYKRGCRKKAPPLLPSLSFEHSIMLLCYYERTHTRTSASTYIRRVRNEHHLIKEGLPISGRTIIDKLAVYSIS